MGLGAASIIGLEGPLGHMITILPFKRNDKTKRQFDLCQETTSFFRLLPLASHCRHLDSHWSQGRWMNLFPSFRSDNNAQIASHKAMIGLSCQGRIPNRKLLKSFISVPKSYSSPRRFAEIYGF